MGKLLLMLVSLGALIALVSQVASEASPVASEDKASKSKVTEDAVAQPETIDVGAAVVEKRQKKEYPPGICDCDEYYDKSGEDDRRKRHPKPKPQNKGKCEPPPGLCCCWHPGG